MRPHSLRRPLSFRGPDSVMSPAQERLPEGTQTHFRSIVTDQFCRVLGSGGSIYAVGDAATIQQVPQRTHPSHPPITLTAGQPTYRPHPALTQWSISGTAKLYGVASVLHHMKISTHTELLTTRLCGGFSLTSTWRSKSIVAAQEKALSHSAELFDRADTSKDGKLQLGEVREILRKSSEDYSHFAEHARFLDGCALPRHTVVTRCRNTLKVSGIQQHSTHPAMACSGPIWHVCVYSKCLLSGI